MDRTNRMKLLTCALVFLFVFITFASVIEAGKPKVVGRRVWISADGQRKQIITDYDDGSYSIDIYEWDEEAECWLFICRKWYAVPDTEDEIAMGEAFPVTGGDDSI